MGALPPRVAAALTPLARYPVEDQPWPARPYGGCCPVRNSVMLRARRRLVSIKGGRGFMSLTDVAVLGAGPYGLAVASALGEVGVEHRVIGDPMSFWREMPEGM